MDSAQESNHWPVERKHGNEVKRIYAMPGQNRSHHAAEAAVVGFSCPQSCSAELRNMHGCASAAFGTHDHAWYYCQILWVATNKVWNVLMYCLDRQIISQTKLATTGYFDLFQQSGGVGVRDVDDSHNTESSRRLGDNVKSSWGNPLENLVWSKGRFAPDNRRRLGAKQQLGKPSKELFRRRHPVGCQKESQALALAALPHYDVAFASTKPLSYHVAICSGVAEIWTAKRYKHVILNAI